ncbi:beta-N-acetylhexosaminidase [Coraliomargarita parva]|uniref:beta-N-acetylhexosaminidase n=1 Tax=Coraliomargarita parva TaxID=3014050 RepID=UPI0022B39482|nr:beta-N-acetylhexosaminidase [Coraliomargarita parva]
MAQIIEHLFPRPRQFDCRNEACPVLMLPEKLQLLPLGWSTLDQAQLVKMADFHFAEALNGKGKSGAGLKLWRDGGLAEQHYRLEVAAGGIDLAAADLAGARYGLHTLKQLFRACPNGLPELVVLDGPDFKQRGYMLDISRCKVPEMETIQSLVRTLAALRYNQLQIYMEHTFAFRDHRRVWEAASPLTAEEVRELDVYCSGYGIELVPNFNSFGHFERWLRHEPYKQMAESPEGFVHPLDGKRRWFGSTLKPDAQSLAFLKGLYLELLPNFGSRSFNIGGDEPWELGKGASRERVEREGEGPVYLDFLKQIHQLVRSEGRTMLFWGDLINRHPELIPELPRDCIALNWGYEADSPHAEQLPRFREAGIDFYVCPGTSAWCSITGRLENCLQNIGNAATAGLENGALGLLLTDWGDGGHHQMPEIAWPGLVTAGLSSWCREANEPVPLESALEYCFVGAGLPQGGAALICEIGHLAEQGRWFWPNRGLFQVLLFEDAYGAGQLCTVDDLNGADLEGFAGSLSVLWDRLEALDTPDAPALLIRDELAMTLSMCRMALAKYACLTGQPILARDDLLALRGAILKDYPRLWRARNREGGLEESMEILTRALAFVDGPAGSE